LLAIILQSDLETGLVEKYEQMAITGTTLEPMDARFFSLLGIISERAGNNDCAQKLYQHALQLQPTEIQALSRRFVFNVNNSNFVGAISIADTISRRWRNYWNLISPYLPYLLDDDGVYNEALKRFAMQKSGKQILVSSLIHKTNSLELAYRLIMDWYNRGESNLRSSINLLSAKLVATGQESKAYQLFRLTLNDAQKKERGYIFNGRFNLDSTENLFDWKLVKQSGIYMNIRAMQFNSNVGKNVLETRFLDSSVRFSAPLQVLYLPSAAFTLKLTYSARNLVTPKPIKLAITCNNDGNKLAVIEILAGSVAGKNMQSSFTVPDESCDLQQIRIFNGNIVESWRNRYSGALYFYRMSIELGGN